MTLGELSDRVSILEIKAALSPEARAEHARLRGGVDEAGKLYAELLAVNRRLWNLEDRMQDLLEGGSDADTAECGRQIALTNRARSRCKEAIDREAGQCPEFKCYGARQMAPV